MLLITEVNEDVRLVCEEKDGKKNYFLQLIFDNWFAMRNYANVVRADRNKDRSTSCSAPYSH